MAALHQNIKKQKLMVAAIDFGTTYSGYAFSFKEDYKTNPLQISINQNWIAGSRSLVSFKTPTCILFDKSEKFVAFGYAAEDEYSELALDEKHGDYYYFRRFKMTLMEKNLQRNTSLESENVTKQMAAKTVFGESVKYLKNHLLSTLDTRGTTVVNSDIHWVLTVPAIWKDNAKQFMREAADYAGIKGEQLTICLEPEAASLYCQHLPMDKFKGNVTFKGSTSKYMVVDLGGGTADITVHEKQLDGTLKEVHEASGGPWGGKYVDERFTDLLIGLVGHKVMQEFSDQNKADALDIYREIETKKQTIKPEMTGKVTVKVPVSLVETFKRLTKQNIKTVIEKSKYQGRMTWTGDKLRMEADLFHELFTDGKDKLLSHLHEMFQLKDVAEVTTILMVGGFSECEILQDAMQKKFGSSRKIVIPEDAGLAVLKGAVLFGHKPQTITQRKAKYTYGINISPTYDRTVHSPTRRVTIDGVDRVKDVFKKYIGKCQPLRVGEAVTGRHVTIKRSQREMLLKVYASVDADPKYVTDRNCEFLGKVVVELPDSDERLTVEVSMIFGETELMVEAREQTPGQVAKTHRAYFDFL
ncbi:heat shock 70 kDa protein 12A-like [Mizuhopecten yessoensis]|uniref:Heat shock 70 kDa protein n=1 Tax=Mizuhopecten yessoensis TaxID=6573 RepID=A0A1C9U2Y4_MIZYE|nr:heat shock 70 kDa protein 12A-like [Mizuhopecten yessoensis]XP_021352056.1 heat shock 70 kDa protein 12A-like [Mizuhopecten yessoensis]XP_021352057.1 heat shock 70 kDa protein 12A-like [Mizuhopecten yessoensis]AOR17347.1 heat shock 70 kDa protein [Mizuhopecten yessoensis]OWF51205.1 Heat shock 70 kDa protein 12A [Mizuhopecten yessoensis]